MVQWIREYRLLLRRLWQMAKETPHDRQIRLEVERLIAGVQDDPR